VRRAAASILAAALTEAPAADAADATLFSAAVPALEPTWPWVAGAALAGLVLGFAIGWHTLARRIRKKYGGLKIY
jgi:hypothetical protein